MKARNLRALFLAALALSALALAAAEPSGAQIVQAAYDRPKGRDSSGTLTMTLIDAKGGQRVRVLKQISGSYGGRDKKLMVFQSPADVRGTAFMNWSQGGTGAGEEQWIYLPALKRVKRISSEGRSDYFMGSDFSYDDMGDRLPSEDEHRLLGSETLEGEPCWVVESLPKDPKSAYSKTVTWISTEKRLELKRDYYDRRDQLQKTLRVASVQSISGVWVIMKAEMHDIQKNHRTRMEFSEMRIGTGIAESEFTERSMTRGL